MKLEAQRVSDEQYALVGVIILMLTFWISNRVQLTPQFVIPLPMMSCKRKLILLRSAITSSYFKKKLSSKSPAKFEVDLSYSEVPDHRAHSRSAHSLHVLLKFSDSKASFV